MLLPPGHVCAAWLTAAPWFFWPWLFVATAEWFCATADTHAPWASFGLALEPAFGLSLDFGLGLAAFGLSLGCVFGLAEALAWLCGLALACGVAAAARAEVPASTSVARAASPADLNRDFNFAVVKRMMPPRVGAYQ